MRVHVKVGWDGALHRLQFKEANTAKKAHVPVLPSMFRGLSLRCDTYKTVAPSRPGIGFVTGSHPALTCGRGRWTKGCSKKGKSKYNSWEYFGVGRKCLLSSIWPRVVCINLGI